MAIRYTNIGGDQHIVEITTDKHLIERVRALGMSVRKRDGEYRINFSGGKEATAYYTNDRDDAYHTAMTMHARHLTTYKPSAAEVIAMMALIKSVGSPHNLRGEFTVDEVRAALVRKTGETVCGATVAAHMRANFAEVERGWFSRRQRISDRIAEVERIAARRGKPPRRRRSMWVGHR